MSPQMKRIEMIRDAANNARGVAKVDVEDLKTLVAEFVEEVEDDRDVTWARERISIWASRFGRQLRDLNRREGV